MFCPHSVFVCFVWISEQTAIISLYSTNWLVSINQAESVYRAVRTEFSNIIPVNMCLKVQSFNAYGEPCRRT